jgi:predicted transcriptional regulator
LELVEIQAALQAEALTGQIGLKKTINQVMASDLMSDVLSFCGSGVLLITGLINFQSVRTADVLDLEGIIFALGKRPSEETIRLALQKNIPLLSTPLPIFEACGILYSKGIRGIDRRKKGDG